MIGTVTMFNVGAVFTVIGFLFGIAALITKHTRSELIELVGKDAW